MGKIEEAKEKARAFFKKAYDSLQPYVEAFETEIFLLTGLRLRVEVGISGESYTDMKSKVVVSISKEEALWTPKAIKMAISFKKDHELQHLLSTNAGEFQEGIQEVADLFLDYGMSSEYAFKYAQFIINGLEDGRIENIMVATRKGTRVFRDWYRLKEYLSEIYTEEIIENFPPIMRAIMQLHSFSCRGAVMKGFEEIHNEGDELRDLVDELKPLVLETKTAMTTKILRKKCVEIAEKLVPLMTEEERKSPSEELLEKILEEMSKLFDEQNIDNIDKGEDFKEQIQTGSADNSPMNDEEKESEEEDSSNDSGNSSKEKGDDQEENSSNSSSSSGGDNKEEEGDSEESSSDSSSSGGDNKDDILEEKIKEAEKNCNKILGIIEEAENLKKQENLIKSQKAKVSKRDSKPTPPTETEIYDMKERHGLYCTIPEIPYNKKDWNKVNCPKDIMDRVNRIRPLVEKELSNEGSSEVLEEMTEGEFDIMALGGFLLGSSHIYKIEDNSQKEECWYDMTILKDNSGSMGGDVAYKCCRAMALLEEIVKGIYGISLKMVDYSDEKHGLIKNFDENDFTYNYSMSYFENEDVDCGQYDAFSIDYYATELAKRPEASSKLLLLLTDGNPVYSREELKEMLDRARESNVTVIVFFIGFGVDYINNNPSLYEDMYGKGNCIAVKDDLSNIEDEFLKVLQRTIKY